MIYAQLSVCRGEMWGEVLCALVCSKRLELEATASDGGLPTAGLWHWGWQQSHDKRGHVYG